MTLDLTESIIPKSDQINFEDLQTGTATYTIHTVTKGNAEQPFNFMLVETDKAYRPSKTMRKVIVAAWGPDATAYAGRRLTLYGEPSIKYAGVEVGGIRISHMSHIAGPVEVMAQTTRGKREKFTVHPLDPLLGHEIARPSEPALPNAEPGASPAASAASAGGGADGIDYDPVTIPFIAKGQLLPALKALDDEQRAVLLRECGIPCDDRGKPTPPMNVGDIKGLLCAKWDALKLPDFEGEPVPVTLLGAIYTARAAAEAFGQDAQDGTFVEPGTQAELV